MTGRIACCTAGGGPWWLTLAALDLFVLVLLASFILIRYFEARDAGIRRAADEFAAARDAFMRFVAAYRRYRVPDVRAAVLQMVALGQLSLECYQRLERIWPAPWPVLEPDPEWTADLMWVQLKAALFRE